MTLTPAYRGAAAEPFLTDEKLLLKPVDGSWDEAHREESAEGTASESRAAPEDVIFDRAHRPAAFQWPER